VRMGVPRVIEGHPSVLPADDLLSALNQVEQLAELSRVKGGGLSRSRAPANHSAQSRAAKQTDDSYLLFLVAPAKAGAQGLKRSVGCPPVQARGKLWVPAFAGMTKERLGTKR
jgi:hypothetical protein